MKASRAATGLLARTEHRIRPDASRTLGRLFVPGQETLIRGTSRAMAVIDRILDLNEAEVERTLARTLARFSAGYRDLAGTLERNFSLVAHRVGAEIEVGSARRQLIGAYFTHEYALEAAALFNPSIVVHPDQAGCQPGEARFIMSLRAVGEGHLSSIEFRTGTIGDDSAIRFDSPGRFLDTGHTRPVPYDRDLFARKLTELGQDDENAQLLWSILPPRFTATELNAALAELGQAAGDPRGLDRARRKDRVDGGVQLRRGVRCAPFSGRTGSVARQPGREPRHGRREVRPLHRRCGHDVLRDIHGVRWLAGRAAPAGNHRLPDLHHLPALRSLGRQ